MADYVKVGLNDGDEVHFHHMDTIETQYDTAKSEFRAGSWDLLGDLLPSVDGAADIGTWALNFDELRAIRHKETNFTLRDDFLGNDIDDEIWGVTYGEGAHVGSYAMETDLDGGVVKITTPTDAANDYAMLYAGSNQTFDRSALVLFDCYAKVGSTSAIRATIGFGNDNSGDNILFVLDSSIANIRCMVDSDNFSAGVDSGVAIDTNFHRFTIIVVSGHIYFYIDEALVRDATYTGANTYNMDVIFYVKMASGSTAKTLSVDRVHADGESVGTFV